MMGITCLIFNFFIILANDLFLCELDNLICNSSKLKFCENSRFKLVSGLIFSRFKPKIATKHLFISIKCFVVFSSEVGAISLNLGVISYEKKLSNVSHWSHLIHFDWVQKQSVLQAKWKWWQKLRCLLAWNILSLSWILLKVFEGRFEQEIKARYVI